MRSFRVRLQGLRDQLPESTPPLPSSITVWDDGGPPGLRMIGPPGSMAAIYVPEPDDPDPAATVHRLTPNAKILVGVDPYLIRTEAIMSSSARRRLTRIRERIVESGTLYNGWLGVVIRARLKCRGEGIEPPSDEAILAERWGVSQAEVIRRLERHAEYIATYHPDLQAKLDDPDLPPSNRRGRSPDPSGWDQPTDPMKGQHGDPSPPHRG